MRQIPLLKAELVREKGPWLPIEDLHTAEAECVDWLDHRRLHGESGLALPVEFEKHYCSKHTAAAPAGAALSSLY